MRRRDLADRSAIGRRRRAGGLIGALIGGLNGALFGAGALAACAVVAAVALPPLFSAAETARGCGPRVDCVIGDRAYRIRMPAGHDGVAPIGAIVHAHGYRGSAAGVMRNRELAALADELGVALIAGQAFYDDWSIPNAPRRSITTPVDEFAYFDAVIADATKRFPIDRSRLLASGFSVGAMMVWNLVCHRSDRFAGFAPVAGTFWRPMPETCAAPPAHVIHLHGDRDRTVPLTGRRIDARTRQGDVRFALSMYGRYGGFGATREVEENGFRCERRRNDTGRTLEFCLFSGGHALEARHLRYAWRRLEAVGAL